MPTAKLCAPIMPMWASSYAHWHKMIPTINTGCCPLSNCTLVPLTRGGILLYAAISIRPIRPLVLFESKVEKGLFRQFSYTDDIIILLNFIFTGLHSTKSRKV